MLQIHGLDFVAFDMYEEKLGRLSELSAEKTDSRIYIRSYLYLAHASEDTWTKHG